MNPGVPGKTPGLETRDSLLVVVEWFVVTRVISLLDDAFQRSCGLHHLSPQNNHHSPNPLDTDCSLLGMHLALGTLLSAREENDIPVLHSPASLRQFFWRCCWLFIPETCTPASYTRLSDQTGSAALSLVPTSVTVSLQDIQKNPYPRLVMMF